VRSDPKVVLGRDGSATVCLAAVPVSPQRQRDGPSLSNPTIEDHFHIAVILEALQKVPVEPEVIPRHDEEVPHHDRIFDLVAPGTFKKTAFQFSPTRWAFHFLGIGRSIG
jgi:hypothetical protein